MERDTDQKLYTKEKSTPVSQSPSDLERLAKKALRSFLARKNLYRLLYLIDDAAQDVLVAYYEMDNGSRVMTKKEFYYFSVRSGMKLITKELHHMRNTIYITEVNNRNKTEMNGRDNDDMAVARAADSFIKPAQQFYHIQSSEAIIALQKIKEEWRPMALAMVDGADLLECCDELNMTPVAAMKMQKEIKSELKKLLDD